MPDLLTLKRTLSELKHEFEELDVKQAGFKVQSNGSYGKLGSPYSVLYAPELMVTVTLTGQLFLLMCIERAELHGATVVSANTDGFVCKVPAAAKKDFKEFLWEIQMESGLNLESTFYKQLHSRDVNNYIAITTDGDVKTKGVFGPSGPGISAGMGLKKNPTAQICADAVVAFLSKGAPIEKTIEQCDDIRKFLVVRRVTGGCEKDGVEIGKVVRYYFSNTTSSPLLYAQSCKKAGDKVPRSDGARPLMTLTDFNECPEDLDRTWYVREAFAMLQDIGYGTVDPSLKGRSGLFMAHLPKQKNLHWVDASTGLAACGRARSSIRESWQEYDYLPAGRRICSKCREAVAL
jgi:hypothetical protein